MARGSPSSQLTERGQTLMNLSHWNKWACEMQRSGLLFWLAGSSHFGGKLWLLCQDFAKALRGNLWSAILLWALFWTFAAFAAIVLDLLDQWKTCLLHIQRMGSSNAGPCCAMSSSLSLSYTLFGTWMKWITLNLNEEHNQVSYTQLCTVRFILYNR